MSTYNDRIREAKESQKVVHERNIPQQAQPDPSESLNFIREKQKLQQKEEKHCLAVKTYKKLFWAICLYILLILLVLSGNKSYFMLADSVLITLLSTTTANILGVFYIASKWLYETDE